MTLLYQIGRPVSKRKPGETEKLFSVDGRIYTESLSGMALKRALSDEGKQTKLVLIYPVSAVFSNTMQPPKDLEQYFRFPKEYLKEEFLQENVDDLFVIHSLGTYMYFDREVTFDVKYDDIVLEIFFELVKRYLQEKPEDIYVDVSTGHNISVVALVEAVGHFLNFLAFLHTDREKVPRVFQAFSDPIIDNRSSIFKIHVQPIEHQFHFSSPLLSYMEKNGVKRDDRLNVLKKALKDKAFAEESVEMRTAKRELTSMLLKSVLVFLSISRSLPLPLYYFDRVDTLDPAINANLDDPDTVKNRLLAFVDYTLQRLQRDYSRSLGLDKEFLIAVVNELALYAGLVSMLFENDIKSFDREKGLAFELLCEKFGQILKKLKIESILFGSETSNLKNRFKNVKHLDRWISMSVVYDSDEQMDSKPDQRNFYAHIGLERTITEVRFEGKEVYLRYREDAPFKTIFKYVLEA
uniref:TIGR01897 family CRISPR-associated protein n=1 Tax=Pseudothermotoga hypogea TaxID=57487 RepID=A0A832MNH8_9THEM